MFCANPKAKWFHGIKVGRGETMVSVTSLQEFTGFDRKTVVKALKTLVTTGEITREKCGRGMKTTIKNFSQYQENEKKERWNISTVESTDKSTVESTDKSTRTRRKE